MTLDLLEPENAFVKNVLSILETSYYNFYLQIMGVESAIILNWGKNLLESGVSSTNFCLKVSHKLVETKVNIKKYLSLPLTKKR